MSFKIAFIGAGSLVFARTLFTDIISVPEFHNIEIAFTDINPDNLEKTRKLCQRDLDANNIPIRIEATTNRRDAFKDARYIVNCVRIGGLEGFETDVEIPLKYGIDQCVGDTLCTGGIMYGQRVIAEMLNFCKDIREVSEPGAIMLNYSNPNAMATWACNKYGKVRTIGLCHGEIHGEQQISEVLGIPREELDVICAGINHQTWYISVKHNGEDMIPKLLAGFEAHPKFSQEEKVRIDMLKRFGYYSTESNGQPAKKLDGSERSKEHASYIIESLETGRHYRGHFNIMNEGCITNLPWESVVEVPCYVDGNGISIPKVGDLPLGCAAVCSQSIWVQKLAVEAAVHGDIQLLKQAAMMDPLTGAVCNPPEIWQMIDEMLVAQEQWLPQYTEAIKAAKEHLANDPLIPTKDYHGAARLREKTPEEVAAERDARKITA